MIPQGSVPLSALEQEAVNVLARLQGNDLPIVVKKGEIENAVRAISRGWLLTLAPKESLPVCLRQSGKWWLRDRYTNEFIKVDEDTMGRILSFIDKGIMSVAFESPQDGWLICGKKRGAPCS